jgi:plasmid stabilization system protein ParE
MKHELGFVLHPGAAQDISEIWGFIAGDNLGAAAHFREEILDAIDRLRAFPRTGHDRTDLTPTSPVPFDS